MEFYRAYWEILAPDLLNVYNENLASGTLPVSCRAIIALLSKNLQDIKNWHPLSLFCTDYKLLSKIPAILPRGDMEQVIF